MSVKTKTPKQQRLSALLAALGAGLAIAAVAITTQYSNQPLLLGSFGASCVLLFGFPESPFSQPRNVLAGHLLCSLIGLVFFKAFGAVWWSVALAMSTALIVMMLTRSVHPPAGSNPVIIFLTQPDWQFLWFPILTGAVILFAISRLYLITTRRLH